MKPTTRLILAGSVVLAFLDESGAQITFTKITTGAIATDRGQFTVGAWADFSGHGLLDLFVCNWGDLANVFYRNNGNGTFTKISQGDLFLDTAFHVCPAVADYDNDGYPDLLVSVDNPSAAPNRLYHNNGDGTFALAINSDVRLMPGFFNACSAVDYDNDGLVDFFVPSNGGQGLLLHNRGDGTFAQPASILNTPQSNGSVAWADYDGDGYMDVIIPYAENVGSYWLNNLYHNNRDGTFSQILTSPVATDHWPSGAFGTTWGDYDNDGLPDLFIVGQDWGNRLYHNNGNGIFANVTSGPMLLPGPGGGSTSCAWGDYDNDGYLDLFIGGYNGASELFHNNGNGTFTRVLTGDPVNDANSHIYCQGCGWADYDNDGFLDLFVARMPDDGTTTTNLLFHNGRNTNAWIEIKLIGTVANRSAIGAKVRIHSTIGGKTFWQLREMSSGGGRWIQPLVAHFGLGDATNIDAVRIEWPSGTVQEFHNIAAKQILTITEPARLQSAMTKPIPQFSLKGGRGFRYEVDSSHDLANWSLVGQVTITNLDGAVLIVDTNAPAAGERFYRAVLR